jgi:hypothetical protein
MASAERTTALLERAGFSEVRTEEVPVRFEIPDSVDHDRLADAGELSGISKPRPLLPRVTGAILTLIRPYASPGEAPVAATADPHAAAASSVSVLR